MTGWTDGEDAVLRARYPDACFGIIRQLASELGRSRNAVIGRANRLGLARHKASWNPKEVHRQTTIRALGSMAKSEIAAEQLWTWAANRVFIVDLEPHHCRWPVGTMEFCGGERFNGSAYCAVHCKFAYSKPQPRTNTMTAFYKAAYR
jgi:hypothetical protein